MVERKIQISNMPKAHGIDSAKVQTVIEKYYDKLSTRLPGEMFMEVHFKESHSTGKSSKREQVEAHVKVVIGGILLHSKHIEWDAEKAVIVALKAVEKEADKAIHKR